MQQFLLNDKVITELHMKTIDLKQRTKFAKKYDMPIQSTCLPSDRNVIQLLLEKQRKLLVNNNNTKNDQVIPDNSPKTKNLLSTLKVQGLFLTEHQKNYDHKNLIKQSCFTVRGIKKSVKQLSSNRKLLNRTCSLVSSMRSTDHQFGMYDVNADLRFKRSPKCFITPKTIKGNTQKLKFILLEGKQNDIVDQQEKQNRLSLNVKDNSSKMTIKQLVDKQLEQQLKKRKAICRTAPTKHVEKMNARQQLAQQYGFIDEDICKVQAKIYTEIRQNRQKAIKRNKQRIGINIDRNKPFSSLQINKNTVKILKKYSCDNMVYFSKFVTKQ